MGKPLNKLKKSLRKRGLLLGGEDVEAGHRFGLDGTLGLHFVEEIESGRKVYVSDEKRLKIYRGGIDHRQKWILGDYRIPLDLIRPGDVMLDVGANVGEMGIWVEASGGKYIAFEPDPTAFKALQQNVSGDLYDIALSDTNGSAVFYLNSAEADSSLFKPQEAHGEITVRKVRLDDFLAEVGAPERLRLLKIEAEGMEPEVLAGSTDTLKRSEYVAVDAGPERGGENTVPDVLNALTGLDFEVLDCFLVRGTFLLRNRAAANGDPNPQ